MLQMHEAHVSSVSQLRRGLSQRQLNMIALGGVIGAGCALAAAVQSFQPDQLVIAEARSSWLRLGLVDRARAAHPIPITHVIPRQRTVKFAAAPLRAT